MKIIGIKGIKSRIFLFLINYIFSGTNPGFFEIKRKLLNSVGFKIGENTKIVGPVEWTAKVEIGKNCWIGKNFIVNGNGNVVIGDNCDIAPEVIIQTGGHEIGNSERRAGKGIRFSVKIGDSCWIGARSTILGGVEIGKSCVVAACACVVKDVENNKLVGGVPAKVIKELDD